MLYLCSRNEDYAVIVIIGLNCISKVSPRRSIYLHFLSATAVADALIKVSPYVLPHNENRQLQIYDATTMLVHRMKAEESRQVNLGKPAIKNKYKYLLKMIQNLEKQA